MKDLESYLRKMSKALKEKIFFLKEINLKKYKYFYICVYIIN